MGNDSGIRKKNKQRTTFHKKHTVYPGMWTPRDVIISAGSIKSIRPAFKESTGSSPKVINTGPLWDDYEKGVKALGAFGGSAALASRRMTESNYRLAYRRLVKAGAVMEVKKKYRG